MVASAQIDAESKDQESHYGYDFDAGEDELGLAVYGNGEDVERHDDDNDDGYPRGLVDFCVPEANDDGGGGDFGWIWRSGGHFFFPLFDLELTT